jgi:FkbM family methyltransferase
MAALVSAAADRLRPSLFELGAALAQVPAERLTTDVGQLWLPADDAVMRPWIAHYGTWEPSESAFLRARLRPGMTLLDVGANVGYFSLLGARAVGPSGTVVAVEPEPANYALLCANLWQAGAGNVVPLRAAASSFNGAISLSISGENCGDHRSFLERPGERIVTVSGVRLDDVLQADAQVDVVKIDIQGADHRAVIGMEGLLARWRPLLLVEFWPRGIDELGDRPVDVLSYYRSLGFSLTVIDRPGADPGWTMDPQLVQAVRDSDSGFATLLLTPSAGTAEKS